MPKLRFLRTVIITLAITIIVLAGGGAALAGESVLWSFGGADGNLPYTGVIADTHGNFYGTTREGGGNDDGTVYKLTPPLHGQTQWSKSILWSFSGVDGKEPFARLIADFYGNLYGTTLRGGDLDQGTVYKLTPPARGKTQWNETVLWSFDPGDGLAPYGTLTIDGRGNLYGTALRGGPLNIGTVIKLTPPPYGQTQWTRTVLLNCGDHLDIGAFPYAGVIKDGPGNLYGTTEMLGAHGGGTVYKLTPPAYGKTQWIPTVLWSFGGAGDGRVPQASVLVDARGNLYGTTHYGGTNDAGTVFKLTPPKPGQTQWGKSVLWSFGDAGDGAEPLADLIADLRGNLYGTTFIGGENGQGTVFKLAPPPFGQTKWSESILWSFDYRNGENPFTRLLADGRGNLFGTAVAGGDYDGGVAFKITP